MTATSQPLRVEVGESVTLTVAFRKNQDPFTALKVLYNPTVPTVVVEKPDGTPATYTPLTTPAVVPQMDDATNLVPQTGLFKIAIIPDTDGYWLYKGVDPDATHPGHTAGHFIVVPARIP